MARWQRNERTLWRAGPDGCLVVLSPSDARPYVVDGSAAALWEALEAPRTVAEIAAELATTFGIEREVIVHDIEPVLALLQERDAVHRVP